MPFLLAEILNFQGSTHRIGVGSFSYIIFAYTENYFISKSIQSTIETNEKLQKLGRENSGKPDFGFLGLDNYFGIGYQPISMDEIPNFLSAEWAVV